MPSVSDNLRIWDNPKPWADDGDKWSGTWGGAEAQWEGALYPRLRRYLPAGTILEIAPGRGRWTQFLIPHCDHLVGVDVSPTCVARCEERFEGTPNVEFHVNDGRSLDCVADGAVDLAFSFDSLVHVEGDVLAAYLAALSTKLAPAGVAFLHHSNLGAYPMLVRWTGAMPAPVRRVLTARGMWSVHLRAPSVTAAWFAACCSEVGLQCIGQEIVNWGGPRLIDCISVVTRRGSPLARPNEVVRNKHFMGEAHSIALRSRVHGTGATAAH